MLFHVEFDRFNPGRAPTPDEARTFIERVIFPTLDRAEELLADGTILSGGPVAGQIALRFIVQADSSEQVDRIVTSLPLWTVAETKVTPLISFGERREHVKALLDRISAQV